MNTTSKYLIVLVGPTAIGKTALSIQLAKHYNCAIFSADSRQFFKEMSIGTAKPSLAEMEGITHHFIGHRSIHEAYNAGKFEEDAISALRSYFEHRNVAILVGGSGLYIDAVCYGIDPIPKDEEIRNQLQYELKEFGIGILQKELEEKDPVHFTNSNVKNPQRLIRALEVCRATGKTYTSFRKNQPKKRDFTTIKIGLTAEREDIYSAINKRVDQMMVDGLLTEVKGLLPWASLNALKTVGYQELFSYLKNEISLDEAIELIKKTTRNFAKRQLTWFKRDKGIEWFSMPPKPQEIIKYIELIY